MISTLLFKFYLFRVAEATIVVDDILPEFVPSIRESVVNGTSYASWLRFPERVDNYLF